MEEFRLLLNDRDCCLMTENVFCLSIFLFLIGSNRRLIPSNILTISVFSSSRKAPRKAPFENSGLKDLGLSMSSPFDTNILSLMSFDVLRKNCLIRLELYIEISVSVFTF